MKQPIMTHLVCGYPNIEESQKLINVLNKYSTFIEVQIPFSDPIADWPIITDANEKALENWITPSKCFEFLEKNTKNNDTNILIMTYYNIVYNYGVEKFIKKSKQIWIYGFIIPDMPYDEKEWQELINLCKKYDINLIQVVSPTCEEKRLKELFSISNWFVYAVSKNMTTWNKIDTWNDFENYIKKLKNIKNIQIWVWFWVKTKKDIENVCKVADFAIMWSELIRILNKNWVQWVENFFNNTN